MSSERPPQSPRLRVVADRAAEQHRAELAALREEALALAAEVARVVRVLAGAEARHG